MDFLKNFNPTPMRLAQLAAVLVAALIVLAIAAQMIAPELPLAIAPSMQTIGSDESFGYGGGTSGSVAYPTAPSAYPGASGLAPTLSTRNVLSVKDGAMQSATQSVGADAEQFEVSDYSATVETRSLEKTCNAFMTLKAKDYVVFENSNSYDHGCSFTFKVAHEHVPEILAWIKELDPKYLNENTYTIKKQIDDFTSEEDILKKKLAEIDRTLNSATAAYDEVTRLATRTDDAGSLASIISSRIDVIQRLTQERLSANAELDRLSRAKAEQLDRLDYTYFRADVQENRFVDMQMIKESWKQSVREVVRVVNGAIQGVTINLLALFFVVLQWTLYALILLVIAKYGWRVAVAIWRR